LIECKQATSAGLIPTFKLSSYFSFASFWLAVRLFLNKKIRSIGSQQHFSNVSTKKRIRKECGLWKYKNLGGVAGGSVFWEIYQRNR
jgi:hypothetical protein